MSGPAISMTSTDTLSTTFAALADPTRRAILQHLLHGEAAVQELARPFQLSLPAISKHLKVLERAGLIERGREAQWRPCRLKTEPLQAVEQWMEQYREFGNQSLDRLDAFLQEQASRNAVVSKSKAANRRDVT